MFLACCEEESGFKQKVRSCACVLRRWVDDSDGFYASRDAARVLGRLAAVQVPRAAAHSDGSRCRTSSCRLFFALLLLCHQTALLPACCQSHSHSVLLVLYNKLERCSKPDHRSVVEGVGCVMIVRLVARHPRRISADKNTTQSCRCTGMQIGNVMVLLLLSWTSGLVLQEQQMSPPSKHKKTDTGDKEEKKTRGFACSHTPSRLVRKQPRV